MKSIKTCTQASLRELVKNNAIQSTIIEVDEHNVHRCYFQVMDNDNSGPVRYNLVTSRSDNPRTFKNPGTICRILKEEKIDEWRVVNVKRK